MSKVCGICGYPDNVCKCSTDADSDLPAIVKCDNISPSHYTKFKIPPNVYITENKLEWEVANVVKYVTRYKDKNGREDLLKAIKYIELLIERKYNVHKDKF